jgi:hypothetical protein
MLVKFSRYRHNEQFWTIPGERDERLAGRKTPTVTEPEPDEYELYDVTADPLEQRNLAHATYATDASRLAPARDARRPRRTARRTATVPSSGAVLGDRPLVTA